MRWGYWYLYCCPHEPFVLLYPYSIQKNCAVDERYVHALSGHCNLAKVKCGRIIWWEYKRELDSIVSFSAVLQLTQHICWWDLCLGLLEEIGGLGDLFGGWLFFQGFGSDLRDPQGFCGCCGAYHKGRAWHRRQTGGWDAAGNQTQWLACSSALALSYPQESAPILSNTSHLYTAESRSHPAWHISRQHISGPTHQIQSISLKIPLASVHWVAVMGSLVLFWNPQIIFCWPT